MSAFFLNICVKFLTFSVFCGISCLEVRGNTYISRNRLHTESHFIFDRGYSILDFSSETFSFLVWVYGIVLNNILLNRIQLCPFYFVRLFNFVPLYFIYSLH